MKIILVMIVVPVIAAGVVIASAMLGGAKQPPIEKTTVIGALPTRVNFLHRHDRFKPTLGNVALLGFLAGCAWVAVVLSLCIYFSR